MTLCSRTCKSSMGFLSLVVFLLCTRMANSDLLQQTIILQCLSNHSVASPSIGSVTYFPTDPSYTSTLQSYIRNLRFISPTTPHPLFIVAPSHVSHIQASIVCCKAHGFEMRIRSGGHDYDGLSYVSQSPFMILDLFNLRSVTVDIEDGNGTAWVDSGATLGELFYAIGQKSKTHGFPAGVCPTVGVGGHFSGGGYGNMMRKHGLSVDNVVDAKLVDVGGNVLDRESMGEDLFWAIRGGGGASFGVILSWKIKLVSVPEIVTVFRIEKTLEQGATDIVHQWQYIADKMDENLFIRVVLLPVNKKHLQSIKAKFIGLFLGNAEDLISVMNDKFPQLGLLPENCLETSWIESTLFWSNYPIGTSMEVLLDRQPQPEKYLKKKSDYIQEPISKENLQGIWKKMIELKRPALTLNPYGGKMSDIQEYETPFPHRAGNIYKIQYSVTWKDEGTEALDQSLDQIRKLYEYMTPYVSKSPRSSYLNYRDVDIGINENGNASYSEAVIWGRKYFKDNFDRLVQVKSKVDPGNFFRYEQSIPCLGSSETVTAE